MTKTLKAALVSAAFLSLPSVAYAQAAAGAVAVANPDEAVQRTSAYTTAVGQMKVTYAAQIAAVEARQKAIQAELQPLAVQIQTMQKAPNVNKTVLQGLITNYQTKQQNAGKELQQMSLPIARAQAYVEEQITGADGSKLNAALKAAMSKKGVALVLSPQATISYQPGVDITADIAAELNAAVPSASIVPPANWQPGQAAAAPAPAPTTTPKPQGR
jgi:Skp family chaperone for outer membrane proteins